MLPPLVGIGLKPAHYRDVLDPQTGVPLPGWVEVHPQNYFVDGGPPHRWLGAVALTFLAVHLVLLLVDPKVSFTIPQLLVPGLAPWQPLAVGFGIVAMWLLLPVTIIGRIRTRLGKAGTALFKRTHVMAYAAWPLATAHYVMAGTDALSEWSLALLISGSIVLVFLLLARGFVPAPTTRTPPAPRTRPAIAGERAGATINAPRETVSA